MSGSLQSQLHADLDKVRRFVHREDWLSLSSEARQELGEAADEFQQRLHAAEREVLCAGFIGGTGVGKSTLMNALAGAEVAETSHRRPHTEQILVYRHQAAELPQFVQATQAKWAEFVHQAGAIKDVVLCDLPDFDSLRLENRESVLEFMACLDLLVWVASPEKYADRSLHEVLLQAPKAAANFYFVLNKVDRLFIDGRPEEDMDRLKRVAADFQGVLARTLASRPDGRPDRDPRIFLVAAREKPPYSPWNQLHLFRDHLLTQRSVKHVAAIKAANLEQELAVLCRPLRSEQAALEQGIKTVHELSQTLAGERDAWRQAGEAVLSEWVTTRVEPLIVRRDPGSGPLFGPARLVAAVVQAWRGRGGKGDQPGLDVAAEPGLDQLKTRMEQVKNRAVALLLRHNPAQSLRRETERILDVPGRWERMTTWWQSCLHQVVTPGGAPRKRIGFAVVQGGVYAVLTLFFFLGIGGRRAWMDVFRDPGLVSGVQAGFTVLEALFSPLGLAALVSYGLLMLVAGSRLYSAHVKRLQAGAREEGRLLTAELTAGWDGELQELEQELERVQAAFKQKKATLEEILSTGRRAGSGGTDEL